MALRLFSLCDHVAALLRVIPYAAQQALTAAAGGQTDETTAYARAVVANEIVACQLVKLACKRHLTDLKHGAERGLVWRPDAAQYRIGFYPRFLRHSKGEWARRPVDLEPWQKFVIGCVFGWKRADGTRRFRYVYEELPAKTASRRCWPASASTCWCATASPAPRSTPPRHASATRRASSSTKPSAWSRRRPRCRRALVRFKLNLSVDGTACKFEPLSSDERTLDGLNPHCVLIDELHQHKTRALLDVLDTALGARRQPLLWIITTAGDDSPESVYAPENDYATKVLEGVIEDDAVFAFIATIDKGDRWDDPVAWAKANPNLGISVKLDDLERQAHKAAKSPAALSAFKRLRLNVRTSSAERAIDMEVWARNGGERFDPAEMKHRKLLGRPRPVEQDRHLGVRETVRAG